MDRPLTLNESLVRDNPDIEIMLADGFDEAFIGVGYHFNKTLAVYDKQRCLQVLVDRDGMTHDEANEYFEFNVIGAYVGPLTPVFMDNVVIHSEN